MNSCSLSTLTSLSQTYNALVWCKAVSRITWSGLELAASGLGDLTRYQGGWSPREPASVTTTSLGVGEWDLRSARHSTGWLYRHTNTHPKEGFRIELPRRDVCDATMPRRGHVRKPYWLIPYRFDTWQGHEVDHWQCLLILFLFSPPGSSQFFFSFLKENVWQHPYTPTSHGLGNNIWSNVYFEIPAYNKETVATPEFLCFLRIYNLRQFDSSDLLSSFLFLPSPPRGLPFTCLFFRRPWISQTLLQKCLWQESSISPCHYPVAIISARAQCFHYHHFIFP